MASRNVSLPSVPVADQPAGFLSKSVDVLLPDELVDFDDASTAAGSSRFSSCVLSELDEFSEADQVDDQADDLAMFAFDEELDSGSSQDDFAVAVGVACDCGASTIALQQLFFLPCIEDESIFTTGVM